MNSILCFARFNQLGLTYLYRVLLLLFLLILIFALHLIDSEWLRNQRLLWLILIFYWWVHVVDNLKGLKDELILRDCSSFVTKHVVQLCQVFVKIKAFYRTCHQIFLVSIKYSHMNVILEEIDIHGFSHLETNREV